MSDAISNFDIFGGKVLTAGGTVNSEVINLERENAQGYFSLHIEVTAGTGTLKAEYQVSNNNTNFVEPTDAVDIFSTFGIGSGPGTDGIDLYAFEPELAKYLRIKFTEDGGLQSVTFSAWLCVQ